jgi:hypothetical protein
MKIQVLLFFAIIIFFIGCGNDDSNSKEITETKNNTTNIESNSRSGIVVDKVDAGSYSYLQLKENDKLYWVAVPTMKIENGESIYFSQYMEMIDFKSETLNRTFESVLFVNDASKSMNKMNMKNPHSDVQSLDKQTISVGTLKDGKTIADIYKNKQSLNGKTVKVKGKVVKFNSGIMNRNWVHIQDGTDNNGDFDLLITSDESVRVGDIIVADGKLAIDKDFGAGYFYPVLVEEAKIIIE